MKELYVKVDFPDIQEFQEHPRFDECIPASTILCKSDGSCVPSCTYFVPVDLYNEVIRGYSPSTGYQHVSQATTGLKLLIKQ